MRIFLRIASIYIATLLYIQHTHAATFTVSNLNNTGVGSLRQAIANANGAGAGGHTINFSVSGTIALTSNLPVIINNNITIDGTGQTVVVSANGADIARYVFRGDGRADFLTVKNLDIKNTGYEPFKFTGSPTDITIENVSWYNDNGNYLNFGINFVGNVNGLTVRNVIARNHQNYGAVIEITGTATNLLVDNLTFDNTYSDHYTNAVEVIRVAGAASNCTIQNCNWNLDNGNRTDDGNYGIYFNNTLSNSLIKNVEILNCEVYAIYVAGTLNYVDISNLTTTNQVGAGGAGGIRFNSAVTNLNLDTISLDLELLNSTNDGDYGIYFNNLATNVNIDSLVIHDAAIYGIYVAGVASNFSISRAVIDNFDGWGAQQAIRFQGNISNLTVQDVVLNGDLTGTTNDGDYGMYFNSATVVGVSLDNVTFNEFDVDGLRMLKVDDLVINNCTFTNNYDGIEFYNNYAKSNNVIKNSTFTNSARGAIVVNVVNAVTEFEIDSNTISDNQYGIWLTGTGGVKDIQIRYNTISENTIAGIYNEQADGVLYSQNSIYNNTMGIDNVANNGNDGLENADGDAPFISASVDAGSGNYDVTFTLPTFCNLGDCDVEFYTNDLGDQYLNGRDYISTSTGLGSGSHTVTLNSGGNTTGYWTATLKVSSMNNSVSEFSTAQVIQPEYPAGVGTGIALWMSADNEVTVSGTTITEWKDRNGVHTPSFIYGAPQLLNTGSDLVNFNPTISFDGNDFFRWDGDHFVNSFTEGDIFTFFKEGKAVNTVNGHVFDMGGDGASNYTYSNQLIYEDFGSSDRKRWNPNDRGVAGGEGAIDATITGSNTLTTNYHLYNVYSAANDWKTFFNGTLAVADPTNTVNFTTPAGPHIGARAASGFFTGNITELILYSRVLNTDERERVNSYLAIKYGKTLGHNYYASDWNGTTGTTFWTMGGGYDNDIAGIARDDNGVLLQKQAKSINDGAIVAIYNEDQSGGFFATNQLSTATPTADKSAMLWGNNGLSDGFAVTYTPNSFTPPMIGSFYLMNRIWNVQETGTIGTVTVTIPYTTRADYLLVHNSSNFGSGTPTEIPLINDGIGNLYAVVDFADGDYFTFGAIRTAPGCVPAELSAWFKGNIGVYSDAGTTPIYNTGSNNVQEWHDMSENIVFDNNEPTQTAVGDMPSYVEDGVNFNPTLYFEGANDNLRTPANINSDDIRDVAGEKSAVYIVANSDNTQDNAFIDHGTSGAYNFIVTTTRAILGQTGTGSYTTNVTEQFRLISGIKDAAGLSLFLDGIANGTLATTGTLGQDGLFNIGVNHALGVDLEGNIAEIIIYRNAHTATEKEKIESYLAIKYGITVSHDYLSGDGAMLWDSSALSVYHNNIAGIGRDNCQALYQKQSKSIITGSIPAIYLGDQTGGLPATSFSNTATIANDKSFMLWGSNGAATTYTGTYPSNTFVDIMERTWLVQESGTVGTVTIVPDDADAQVLLVDADGDFTDGNSIEILLENGMTTYDFADGDYFTFGTLTCKETSTLVCDASVSVNLIAYVWGYQFGGFWTETTSSGVDLSDPTAVDFSSAAIGTYAFTYTWPAVECHTINVDKVVSIPAPTIDDILVCEGGSTTITIPPPAERREVVWEQNFNGNAGWRIRSRCRGSDVSDCYIDNSARFSLEDLQLDDVTDFSVWRRGYWSWVYSGPGRMQFGRLRDQEISLSIDSLYELKPGETMLFSGEAARWWGVMEPNDYVKFLYVVDGIETEFDSRNGNISTAFTASEGSYTNNSGSTQFVQMRVKVKNSWNEGHRIDNFKMTKILASPTYNFYDDAGLTTLLSSGLNYTSNTAAGTIDTIYVTRLENGCESSPDTVFIEVSPNSVTPMGGEMAYYCTGGGTVDLTAHISNYQAGGTWIDQDGTGVSLTNPTAVDVSALADSSYNFIYVLNGIAPCQGEEAVVTINIGLSPPAPEIDDIIGCEGLSTVISVPADPEEEEILYNQPFDGFNGGYNLLGRCTSDDITSCRRGNLAAIANRGLTLDTSAIDFSNWTRWATALYDANNLRFIRLKDEEIVLSTDSFIVLAGEVAHFSGDSRRYFGVMEATDYVKFFYVINGVETEFDSRNGNISTAFSTSQASYENSTAAPVYVQLRVKVKCSFDEAYILDNFKISKTLNQPTYKFYDDSGLTTLLATGNSYDPGTTVGNTDIVYVTRYENACESLADTVTVTITPNDISPMTGDEYYYCGGTSTDLTSLVTTYVAGGTWTDLDTAGVTLGDGSAVDFSAVAGGTYNFLYTLTGSCADEEVIVTVHIGIMGASPYVVADNNVSTALTECVEGNWIYFIDPTDDSRRIAAINTNGNVIAPSAFTVRVDVDAPAVDLERASGTGATGKAVRLMRRQVQINCATCGTLSPAVDVRLYWEASEQTDAGTAMDVLMATNSITGTKYWEWFKVEHNVADIPANLTADGIENPGANAMVWSVADASGTESNSVEYVQFNGIANFSTFGGGWFVNQPDGTILPVEMLYLEAKPINNEYIQLDWATATEINNEGFELQRSIDGKEFSTIAWIDGHGNSQSVIAYNYNDKDVIALQTYYYRLKQVDFDGKTEYSKIVSSKLNDNNKTVFEVTLIPNPTKGTGKVSINTTSAENITFKVYGSIGKVVLEKALLLEKGLNQFDIHLENLATGTYNVILYGEKTKPVKLKWMVIK